MISLYMMLLYIILTMTNSLFMLLLTKMKFLHMMLVEVQLDTATGDKGFDSACAEVSLVGRMEGGMSFCDDMPGKLA